MYIYILIRIISYGHPNRPNAHLAHLSIHPSHTGSQSKTKRHRKTKTGKSTDVPENRSSNGCAIFSVL